MEQALWKSSSEISFKKRTIEPEMTQQVEVLAAESPSQWLMRMKNRRRRTLEEGPGIGRLVGYWIRSQECSPTRPMAPV